METIHGKSKEYVSLRIVEPRLQHNPHGDYVFYGHKRVLLGSK